MGGRQLRGKKRYLLQLNEEGAGREGAGREGAGREGAVGVCLSIEKRGTERERGEREREGREKKKERKREKKREREENKLKGGVGGTVGYADVAAAESVERSRCERDGHGISCHGGNGERGEEECARSAERKFWQEQQPEKEEKAKEKAKAKAG